MNSQRSSDGCADYRDGLVRLACGDALDPSRELLAHLSRCPACREELAASRGLVGSLRTALEPQPIRRELQDRIRTELGERPRPLVRARESTAVLRYVIGTAAAAAAILGGIMIPRWLSRAPRPPASDQGEVALSEADSAAIVGSWAAVAALWWDSPVDHSADYLKSRLEDIDRTVAGDSQTERWLPWGADDDWDLPTQGQGPSGARTGSPACALRDAGTASDGRV